MSTNQLGGGSSEHKGKVEFTLINPHIPRCQCQKMANLRVS